MKVKMLIVLSILFFAIGSLGGAAYAFVSGGNVLHSVSGLLPASKTPEEKLIDDFIKEQEKKQQNDTQQPPAQKDDQDEQKPSTSEPETKDDQTPSDTTDTKDSNTTSQKRMGQPTVSDNATLNVRKTPKDGEVLIGIPNTEKVEIIGEKNGWYQIITANGTKGWVSAEYLKEL